MPPRLLNFSNFSLEITKYKVQNVVIVQQLACAGFINPERGVDPLVFMPLQYSPWKARIFKITDGILLIFGLTRRKVVTTVRYLITQDQKVGKVNFLGSLFLDQQMLFGFYNFNILSCLHIPLNF